MLAWLARTLALPGSRADGDQVKHLYARTVLALGATSAVLAYVWLFAASTFVAAGRTIPRPSQILPPLILTAGLVTAITLHRRPTAAALSLVISLVISLFLWPDPLRYYLAPATVCICALLLSRYLGLLTALALANLPAIPQAALAATWLTAVALFLATDYIYALVHQAIEREDRAARLEQELLARRGELRRLNDSLRNAYTLLERTNHELAEARDEAEQARRLKTQFAATISHELRTPLNLILGFSEVMHKMPELYAGAVLTPDLRGDIREIYRSTKHLLELVDDVLDLSRVEQVRLALVPEDTDMAALIQEAAATVAGLFRNKPVQLRLDVPADLPRCLVDRTRIRQVLINLLANAARFTEQGEVAVSARFDADHGEIITAVSDTGPGIEEEERLRVFDAFYQVANPLRRQQGGTGLGLAICKTFVQMHGGRIWVESSPGQGSRFSFAIPLRSRLQAASEWKLPGAEDPFGDSIVTVDTSGRLANTLARALPHLKVHNVADAAQVRETVSRYHPKAVVAFSRNGEPGYLADTAPWPGLPFISCRLTSAKPLSAYANVRAVITKPITPRNLLAALDTLGPIDSLLVADDDEGMTRLIQRTLTIDRPGINLQVAHDGRTALNLMRELKPDAAILDLAMPEMDGLEVLDSMADDELAGIPVLVLTAMDLESGGVAAEQLVVASCPGLGEADLVRYVEALAQAARPRYVAEMEPQMDAHAQG